MKQIDCSTENKKGKHLIYEERIKLEALSESGLTPTLIGQLLGGRSRRTIERELARGRVELMNSDLTTRTAYSATVGQQKHDSNAENKGPALKIGHDHKLATALEKHIMDGCSPYAAIEKIKHDGENYETMICYKTAYNYLDMELFQNITNKDLLIKKNAKKRDYHRVRQAFNNRKGKSISERPTQIETREEFGHWEIDLVVGKQGTKPVILTLVERKSRKSIYILVKNKTQKEVIRAIRKAHKRVGGDFSEVFKTITADNGSEFLDFEAIKKAAKCSEVYYAHPYSSWERGSNENGNRILRRFVPKGTDIGTLSAKKLQEIEDWVNNYPRKILNGFSANQFIRNSSAA